MEGLNIASFEFTNDQWAVLVPIILMSIDILTGLMNAWSKGTVKSSIMRQGLAKKFGEITVLAIGHLFVYGIKMPKIIITVFAIYIVVMELISICENLEKLGVPIPKFIKRILKDASEKMDNADPGKVTDVISSKADEQKDGVDDGKPV